MSLSYGTLILVLESESSRPINFIHPSQVVRVHFSKQGDCTSIKLILILSTTTKKNSGILLTTKVLKPRLVVLQHTKRVAQGNKYTRKEHFCVEVICSWCCNKAQWNTHDQERWNYFWCPKSQYLIFISLYYYYDVMICGIRMLDSTRLEA